LGIQDEDDGCYGTIGSFSYSLKHLAVATDAIAQNVTDSQRNVYYYRVCDIVPFPNCKSLTHPDDNPALCQEHWYNHLPHPFKSLTSKEKKGRATILYISISVPISRLSGNPDRKEKQLDSSLAS